MWKTKKDGKFAILSIRLRKDCVAKVKEIKDELKKRMHDPIREVGQWLKAVLQDIIDIMVYQEIPMQW